MRNYLLVLITLLSLSACNRREDRNYRTSVSGTVIDQESLDTIAGATVYILKADPANSSLVAPIETLTADSEGKFSYNFTADPYYNYFAFAASGNYLFYDFGIITKGRSNSLLLKLYKPGYLALHVKNNTPFDNLDKIHIVESDYYNRDIQFSGMTTDTIIYLTNYGNKTNQLNWKVTKNDTTITYNQLVNFISLDTVALDLFY